MKFSIVLLLTLVCVYGEEEDKGAQGTISFLLHTDQVYKNGKNEAPFGQLLVSLKDFAGCYLQKNALSVSLFFYWNQEDQLARGFHFETAELNGPETYSLIFTWDAKKGLSDGYMNGIPMRVPGVCFEPWDLKGGALEAVAGEGPCRVTDLKYVQKHTPKHEVIKMVPEKLLNKSADLHGAKESSLPIDIEKRKGALLYSTKMDTEDSVKGWVVEGPGDFSFEDNKMTMRSLNPNPKTRGEGHVNFWCPKDFPESFVANWEFEQLSPHGLCIIFFSALGAKGEDIFDPSLPKRDGRYPQYTSGAIHNYHITYYCHLPLYQTGRTTTRLRRGNTFYFLDQGPIAVPPKGKDFTRMQLIKDGAHIQLFANDRLCLDFTDPGTERWGKALGKGKIALRQMAVTRGAYRNFKVWRLNGSWE